MYGMFTYIQLIVMVNVGKYTMDAIGTLPLPGLQKTHRNYQTFRPSSKLETS